ncbi:MAG: thioredoxin family protein [Bacteroidetes bacterium]|nr:MAG: thioredoxin family protein [Bacteroidota bacterium]
MNLDWDFSLVNVDGTLVSLSGYPDARGFIVIFSCNHCPYVIASEERIKELDRRYTPLGFPLIAISSNDVAQYPQDSFEQMQVRAREKEFHFPYLYDESQEVARRYGAERTPHAFVLLRRAGELHLIYKGAIDNSPRDPAKVTERYLAPFLDRLIETEEAEYQEVAAIGCTVKWKL